MNETEENKPSLTSKLWRTAGLVCCILSFLGAFGAFIERDWSTVILGSVVGYIFFSQWRNWNKQNGEKSMAKQYKNYDEMPVEEKKKMHKRFLGACVASPVGLLYLLFVEGHAQDGTHFIVISIAGFIFAAIMAMFHLKKLKELS